MAAGRRPRDPRPPEDADEDVLPLRARVLRGAEHAHVPGVSRASGCAAGRQPPRGRVDDQARPRARLRDRRRGRLLAQELLLSRQPEGLPDLAVRPAALRRRLAARARPRGRTRDRLRACAPRGGRGEDDSRRRRNRAEGRLGVLADRLQPRRHAARRDRHAAGHSLRRRGCALPAPAAADDRRARDLRRGDGEGHAARRRERLSPSSRRATSCVRAGSSRT